MCYAGVHLPPPPLERHSLDETDDLQSHFEDPARSDRPYREVALLFHPRRAPPAHDVNGLFPTLARAWRKHTQTRWSAAVDFISASISHYIETGQIRAVRQGPSPDFSSDIMTSSVDHSTPQLRGLEASDDLGALISEEIEQFSSDLPIPWEKAKKRWFDYATRVYFQRDIGLEWPAWEQRIRRQSLNWDAVFLDVTKTETQCLNEVFSTIGDPDEAEAICYFFGATPFLIDRCYRTATRAQREARGYHVTYAEARERRRPQGVLRGQAESADALAAPHDRAAVQAARAERHQGSGQRASRADTGPGEERAGSSRRRAPRPRVALVGRGSGRAAPVYQPYKGRHGAHVSRPTIREYTPERVRAWVAGRARDIAHAPGAFTSVSDGAFALMGNSWSGSRRATEETLSTMRVDRIDPKRGEPMEQRPVGRLHVRVPGAARTLTIGGGVYSSLQEWEASAPLLRRHKPLYRKGLEFFQGLLSPSEELRLRGALGNLTIARHQGQAHSFEVRADDLSRAASSLSSANVTVRHEVGVELFPELIDAAREAGVPAPRLRVATQIASYALSVVSSTSYEATFAATLQLVAGVPFLWSKFHAGLMALEPRPEKQGPLPASLSSLWDIVMSSAGMLALREFVGELWEAFFPSVVDLAKSMRTGFLKAVGDNYGKKVLEFFTELGARLKRCVKEASFAPLWGTTWDPGEWMSEARAVVRYYPLLSAAGDASPSCEEDLIRARKEGGLPSWWTTRSPEAFLEAAQALLVRGRSIQSAIGTWPGVGRDFSLVLGQFVAFVERVEISVQVGKFRVAPFFIFYHGAPSTGKTNIAATIARSVAAAQGYDTGDSSSYHWRPAANFQDGLTHSHWHVVLDDIDQSVATPTAGIPTHAEVVIDLVNNKPLPVEAAAVEMKGRIAAMPLLVSMCSNYENARLKGRIVDPSAFWRRVGLYVEVKVREEFQAPGGALDIDKASASRTHDMFDLEVSEYDRSLFKADDPFSVIPMRALGKMTLPEFSALVVKRFRANLKQQTEFMRRACVREDVCPSCFMPASRECGCAVQQGPCLPSFRERMRARATRARVQVAKTLEEARNRFLGFVSDPVVQRVRVAVREVARKHIELIGGGLTLAALVMAIVVKVVRRYQGRIPGGVNVPEGWMRPATDFGPGRPPVNPGATFTREELDKVLRRCFFRFASGGWAVMVSHNAIMYPTHLIDGEGELELPGGKMRFSVTALNTTRLPNEELSITRVSGLPGERGVTQFIPLTRDETQSSFDEVVFWALDKETVAKRNWVQRYKDGPLLCTDIASTEAGDCGKLYLGRIGAQWFIRGMHYLRFEMNAGAFTGAAMFSGREISSALARVGTTFQGVETPVSALVKGDEAYFGPLPLKSEVGYALGRGAFGIVPLGELWPRPFGSTPKTNVRRLRSADRFREFELEWCGEIGYWRGPAFRGAMLDGVWTSPYQDALLSRAPAAPLEKVWLVAIMDYLSGVGELARAGYRFFSEEEVIAGVPEFWVNPINAKTSTGPPYNVKKYLHYFREGDEVAMSPQMCELTDAFEDVLKRGHIPAPFARCV